MSQVWWYATRAAGLMTWATAVSSVILGLLMASGGKKPRKLVPNQAWILDLHRFVGGLSLVFLATHMFTLWADSFVDFGPKELLIPGASEWKPLAGGLGVVSAWVLAGVEASSLLKRFLPPKVWHGIHLGSYLVALVGTAHAVKAGSDVSNPIVAGIGLVLLAVMVGLTVVRVAKLRLEEAPSVDRASQLAKARRIEADRVNKASPPPAPSAPDVLAVPSVLAVPEALQPPVPAVLAAGAPSREATATTRVERAQVRAPSLTDRLAEAYAASPENPPPQHRASVPDRPGH